MAGWLAALAMTLAAGCSEPAPPDADPATGAQGAGAQGAGAQDADLILSNGAFYTLNPEQPWAESMAIGDGRILAVGSSRDIEAAFRGDVRDLDGAMVLPGFHDAHSHPIAGGIQSLQCDLTGAASVEETLERIEACHREMPPGESAGDDWLVGGGWNLGLFPDGNPHKRLLDDIAGDRPVYLEGEDGHSGWVNSAGLERANITADTEDPPQGVIERDADGEPTGTLRETAQELVRAELPEITEAQREAGALAALEMANSFGITSIVAASVDGPALSTWRRLESDGRLTARIVTSIRRAGYGAPASADLLNPGSRGSGALVRADAAKIFLDGVLEGETAALLDPYLDPRGRGAGRTGILNVPWEELRALVTDLDARGIQVHMHAIGDRAVRQGLDAVEAAQAANGPSDNRHHICHLQLVHPDDYERFGELGVLANFQALWAFPDAYITDINMPAVGEARVQRMYPIASIAAAGGTIVGGSDWSVSSMNPLDAIEVAVTRQDPDGLVEGVLNPAEAVSLETMLAAYTRNAAFLMHQEHDTGTLQPGKLADLVVLDANLFEIEPAAINDTAVVATYLAGERVYP
ncbi:MAG: amidohydrolase [Gammaproteobacteria bacterium]|nr:amidohydrolase [Gammaproteobacteria bacterium]